MILTVSRDFVILEYIEMWDYRARICSNNVTLAS